MTQAQDVAQSQQSNSLLAKYQRARGRDRVLLTVLVLGILALIGVVLLVLSETYVSSDPWKTLLNVLGGFLAISVMASFLYSVVLQPQEQEVRAAELRRLLDEKIDPLLHRQNAHGLAGFQSALAISKLFDDLNPGQTLWWLDTYAPGPQLWVPHLRDALVRGARIKMLVINPDCPNARNRASELGSGYKPERFKSEANLMIRDLLDVQVSGNNSKALELRWYEDLPCAPIYIIARGKDPVVGYTSFFLGKPTGVDFPHLRWEPAEHGFLDMFMRYVEEKWERNGNNQMDKSGQCVSKAVGSSKPSNSPQGGKTIDGA